MNQIQRLNKRLIFIITGVIILSMMICLGYNLKIFRQSWNQRNESQKQALRIYVRMMETYMSDIETLVISQSMDQLTLQKINRSRKKIHFYQALAAKRDSWNEELDKYKMLNGLFLYDTRRGCYMGVKSSEITDPCHTDIKENTYAIIQAFQNTKNDTGHWFSLKIKDEYYLFYMLCVNRTYFAAWMKPENMIDYLKASDPSDDTKYFISDNSGTVLNRNDESDKFRSVLEGKQTSVPDHEVIQISSEKKKITVFKVSPLNWGAIISTQFVLPLLLILIAGISILVFVLFVARKAFISPVHTLLLEAELEKKSAQLQFLQNQISPHFLNNCLSLIRNLILADRGMEAADAAVILSKYTRTSLHTKSKVVLAEELTHVNAYYKLQKMRYSDARLELITEVPEDLMSAMVPAMVIQTFVENAVKHRTGPDEPLKICIKIKEKENEQIHIRITDTGKGFSKKALDAIHASLPFKDEYGFSHVGIYNIVQRIQILYGDKAAIRFQNGTSEGNDDAPAGAVINIFLPMEWYSISETEPTE